MKTQYVPGALLRSPCHHLALCLSLLLFCMCIPTHTYTKPVHYTLHAQLISSSELYERPLRNRDSEWLRDLPSERANGKKGSFKFGLDSKPAFLSITVWMTEVSLIPWTISAARKWTETGIFFSVLVQEASSVPLSRVTRICRYVLLPAFYSGP